MSWQYDLFLRQHKENVKKGFNWICCNLPELTNDISTAAWQTEFSHDSSKEEPDEYEAYDAYFYGGNRSYAVVQDFQKAWLLHIHRNPHHWQYWVLINDDPKEGEIILEMPYDYILEMICDWWSFSWASENLYEIFEWYGEHKNYMKLGKKTRKTVEDILEKIQSKLDEAEDEVLDDSELQHHGVKGMKWGVKNGPPYPIDKSGKSREKVAKAIDPRVLKNAAGEDIIAVKHVDLYGAPNSITQVTRKNGGIDRNYYDELGRQSKQLSNHDHGQPEKHPYGEHGEHVHDYIYDEKGAGK